MRREALHGLAFTVDHSLRVCTRAEQNGHARLALHGLAREALREPRQAGDKWCQKVTMTPFGSVGS
jgi:hypothetical protein